MCSCVESDRYTNIRVNFNHLVKPLNGYVSIMRNFDNTVFENIDIWSNQIYGGSENQNWYKNGDTSLIINPKKDLNIGVDYYLNTIL